MKTVREKIAESEKADEREWYPQVFFYEYVDLNEDTIKTGFATVNCKQSDNWLGLAAEVIDDYLDKTFPDDSVMLLGVRLIPDWLEGIFLSSNQ